ncbi:MAG TPA: EAL domain-containing protein [Candidatus Baltobacteraceae bacterium]|jgi:diguanylate cyclase (GGDEF)-like protein|nr:EAL domain-containing protein [Candidatus Baltobacteraceae bacterium]
MGRSKTAGPPRANESLDLVLRWLPAYIFAADTQLRFTAIRGAVLRALGLDDEAIARLIGTPAERYFTGPEGEPVLACARDALNNKSSSLESSWLGRWFSAHIGPVCDEDGNVIGVVGIGMDQTERRRLQEELEAERFMLNEAQQLAELGSWVMDVRTGETRISPELARLLGIPPVSPQHASKLEQAFHPAEIRMMEREKQRALRSCGPYEFAHRIVTPEGRVRYVRSRGHVQCDERGKPVRCIGTMLDVTELTKARQVAELLAYHDSLTGLPNRWLLSERLERATARSRRERNKFVLLFIDLDNFKRINDSLGHAEGDVLLAEVAHRLRRAVRETDTVARMGGDEFVVLLNGIDAEDDGETAISKVVEAFWPPFTLRGDDYVITGSVGVAVYPDDAKDEREILQHADMAMYEAKQSGRNCMRRYRNGTAATTAKRLQLERDVGSAVSNGEFRLLYQPIVDAKSARICGFEALLRWQHPRRGLLAPKSFMDVLENSEHLDSIGEWILGNACAQAAQWRRSYGVPIRMSVNVSARQMTRERHFIQLLAGALRQSGLDPEALEIEITETAIMRDLEWAIALLSEVRDLGVGIAIDDFGTGYNSLSYLKHFPVTALKIDRSFVGEIGIDAFDEAISFAVAALGRALRIRVVAEGVETQRQHDALQILSCDELQGFYFSPPLDGAQAGERIASGAAAASR